MHQEQTQKTKNLFLQYAYILSHDYCTTLVYASAIALLFKRNTSPLSC